MAHPVLVVGHRNPDNDSISSAVAYAHLKNKLAERDGLDLEYIPARLGQMPQESSWIMEEFGLEPPVSIAHVYSRVGDVMTPEPISISVESSMLKAGHILRKHNVRSLVALEEDGSFAGLIGTRAIAERYMSATDNLVEGDMSSTMAVAASLIDSLSQKVGELVARNVLTFDEEKLLHEATEDLMASELREGVVLDDDGHVVGIVTRSDVAANPKRKVILVDHNEKLQAAPGIDDADVIEIVDHHRIADVTTSNPIQFLNLPLGSTATIVALEYEHNGIEIPKGIAAAMLSAIMTDTVILKSPTTTQIDRDVAERLAKIVGVDVTEFGLEVFKARGGGDNLTVKDLIETDSKEFTAGDDTVLIAQHETVDLAGVLEREQEIREHLRKLKDDHGYSLVLLMVTDIMAEGSQFLAEGDLRLLNRVFGIKCTGKGGTWMPGVLSRKKQVAAKLLG